MNKFTAGFIVGNIVGMTGLILESAKSNKSIKKTSKTVASKVGQIVDDIVDMYK